MLEQSTFNNDEIKKMVYENYGIEITNIKRINQGTANIFKIENGNNEYVLKEFQSKYKKEDIIKEINAIQYLQKNTDIPLPTYIKMKNENYCFEHLGKIVILQKFIKGTTINKNEGNYNQTIDSAKYLGKIVNGFEKYNLKDSINVIDWFSKHEMKTANEKFDKILNKIENNEIDKKIKKDILFKKELLKKIQNKFDVSKLNNITHTISHGDYNCLQFIYNSKNEINAIIDFVKVKKLPIVWEIARSYTYIDEKASNGQIDVENLIEYVKEYMKYAKLNEYDLELLPYIYLMQLARSPFGYEQYYKNVENKDELIKFAFYRTNICRSLDEKADEISNRLRELEND